MIRRRDVRPLLNKFLLLLFSFQILSCSHQKSFSRFQKEPYLRLDVSLEIFNSVDRNEVSSFIYLEKKNSLRFDILGAFYTPLVSFIYHDKTLSLIDWDKKVIFENKKAKNKIRSFLGFYPPPLFLRAVLLQDKSSFHSWDCKLEKQQLSLCKKNNLQVTWKYKRGELLSTSMYHSQSKKKLLLKIQKIKTKVFKNAFLKPAHFQIIP